MKVRTRFYVFAAILLAFAVRADLLHAGWPELDKLVASDGVVGDNFGICVSVSGDYAIVGAYGDDDNGSYSGSAYIFKRDGTTWSQQAKLLASDGNASDWFGYAVSISGNYAIVGAYGDDDNGDSSGSAYIFKQDGAGWSQQDKLTASDGDAGDNFGLSVSVNGDYAIVGAPYNDDNGNDSGSAYVFHFDGISWKEQDKPTASDAAVYDHFGYCVSISGDYAIVGAHGDDDNESSSGSAYIFAPNEVDPNNWDQVAKLLASDGAAGDWFGWSVSVSGDYALVGALNDEDNGDRSGSAYIFAPNEVDPNNWEQVAKLTASDGVGGDNFGFCVSISGDYALIGARYDDDTGDASGSAYIFRFDGINWSEEAKLLASDGAAGDEFGKSVSVSGDYAIVGAPYNDDNGIGSGSAYVLPLCPYSDATGDCFVDFRDLSVMGDEWLRGFK